MGKQAKARVEWRQRASHQRTLLDTVTMRWKATSPLFKISRRSHGNACFLSEHCTHVQFMIPAQTLTSPRPRISIDFTPSTRSSCQKLLKAKSCATVTLDLARTGLANGLIENTCSQHETFVHCVIPSSSKVYDIRNCVERCARTFGNWIRL